MSTRLAKRAAASGFIAAALATILGSSLSPEHPTTAFSLITRAVAYITAVFGLAAIASQLVFVFRRKEHNPRSEDIAIHTATAALWLPPLLMFCGQRSWFALVIFLVLALAMARLMAFLKAVSFPAANAFHESSREYLAFTLLKQDFPFGSCILAAFMLQGAIFAALDNHVAPAGLLCLAGTTAVVHRSFQMFRDLPAIGERDSTRSISAVLFVTTFLIVFAWLPYVVQGGTSGGGSSLARTGSGHPPIRGEGAGLEKSKKREGNASTLAWLKSLFSSEPSGARGNEAKSGCGHRRCYRRYYPWFRDCLTSWRAGLQAALACKHGSRPLSGRHSPGSSGARMTSGWITAGLPAPDLRHVPGGLDDARDVLGARGRPHHRPAAVGDQTGPGAQPAARSSGSLTRLNAAKGLVFFYG